MKQKINLTLINEEDEAVSKILLRQPHSFRFAVLQNYFDLSG